jgi:hypothetical protein
MKSKFTLNEADEDWTFFLYLKPLVLAQTSTSVSLVQLKIIEKSSVVVD